MHTIHKVGRRVDTENNKENETRKTRNTKGIKRRVRTVLIAAEVLAILAELIIMFVITKLDQVQKVNISVDELQSNISDEVKESAENGQMKGYTNIALFGVDTRTGELESGTRSDTILIASINNETSEVKLVSVYRDTYMNLGNDTYNKANAAYSEGGPTQAINMLNMNLDLNITDFITVGFAGLVDVIDALGGIDLEITDAEIDYLNDYEKIMAGQLNMEYVPVTEAGTQHLSGLQATAYCRIRYTKGDDFKRTERQRLVLSKVFEEAKGASVSQLNAIVDAVTDEIYTSLSTSEILDYVADIGNYSIADTSGFPQDDMRMTGTVGRKGSCVIPVTLQDNVTWLHEYLFDETDYAPSSKVQEYSQKVEEDTGYTLDEDGTITAYTGDGTSSDETAPSDQTTTTRTDRTTTTNQTTTAATTDPYAGLASMVDPNTGATVWYDPYTGVVIDPSTGAATGAMADPATGNVVEPGATAAPAAAATTPAATTAATAAPAAVPATPAADPNAAAAAAATVAGP